MFDYDYMGRRVSKKVYDWNTASNDWALASETRFIFDGWNMLREQSASGGNVTTNWFVWGLDLSGSLQGAGGIGGLLSAQLIDPATSNSTTVVYTYCANGNVSECLTTGGEIAAHYEYSPFAALFSSTGRMAKSNPIRFSTKWWDDETGLGLWGMRWYSPAIGKWLSRDPIGESGGKNLYVTCGNNMVDFIDPSGLKWDVDRKGESRADAWNECGDTVDDLAKEIHLDPGEFRKWLEGVIMPATSGEKIMKQRKFTVPNEAHITQGNLEPSYGIFPIFDDVKTRKDDYVEKYKKYAVKDHFTASDAGNGLGAIAGWLGNKDIAVWAHFGHGERGTGKLFIGKPATTYGPASFKPHHKLSEVVLFSCFAGQNSGWASLIAPGGSLFASDKAINPSWMGWPWVSEDEIE